MVLANHDLNVDAEIVRMSQTLDHPARRSMSAVSKIQKLDIHYHAFELIHRLHSEGRDPDPVERRSAGFRNRHSFRNIDPLLNTFVVRLHVASASTNAELPDHRWMRAPQDFDYLPIGAASRLDPCNSHQHPIT